MARLTIWDSHRTGTRHVRHPIPCCKQYVGVSTRARKVETPIIRGMGIEQEFIDRHPKAAALYQRANKVLPSGVTHDSRFVRPFPIYAERAAGSHKRDADGFELIDYVMGHGALLLGHNHPAVMEAALAQLARGTHYGASQEREIEWAEEVVRLVPSAEKVRFTSSGTE